mmetsp:Transcript_9698/g.34110  ORF Transcript_9698/g.34110 Transcript_9698/m.34110 type:complete len:209 (-) Transcript_9698:2163-2789(-)
MQTRRLTKAPRNWVLQPPTSSPNPLRSTRDAQRRWWIAPLSSENGLPGVPEPTTPKKGIVPQGLQPFFRRGPAPPLASSTRAATGTANRAPPPAAARGPAGRQGERRLANRPTVRPRRVSKKRRAAPRRAAPRAASRARLAWRTAKTQTRRAALGVAVAGVGRPWVSIQSSSPPFSSAATLTASAPRAAPRRSGPERRRVAKVSSFVF